ncbi:pyridoxal-phosphate dependent enzyme [Leeia oryzae]|uniref:pyridoxal-phosphate dependent enzyme n=1 Tax=Leeia oryzae TaxID=356662 RepID=UPI0003785B59|nr:pyridoxal-phosphate dependent enzyme [Leeia oryzae]
MPLHIATPLIQSAILSARNGRDIWLKMEALQPPGSFKIRGVGAACEAYAARGAQKLLTSSGGNAGLAVAYAGQQLGLPVTVVVPETTTERAIRLLRDYDATVMVHGPGWHEANQKALSLIDEQTAFIHPFDDPLLWQGHASMIDEVAQQGLRPDAVVVAVGGGGLLSGVAEGMQRQGWDSVPLIAVETVGAASFHAAVEAGERVTLPAISSVATSLGARQVCQQAFQWAQTRPVISRVVSDKAALQACEQFLSDQRVLVEPACGAALALAYEQSAVLDSYRKVLFIVCGGATAGIDQIRQWLDKA